jgi:protein O-mannosyl-transferase
LFFVSVHMPCRDKLLNYLRSRDRGWILSLFMAVCLLYLPFLGNPFVFDDMTFFFSGTADHYAHSWFHFDLRWLPNATLGWTELAFSNVVTHFFHLGNLLLHAANVIFLFYLLRQLVTTAVPDCKSSAVVIGSWFAALIFALHPVAVYAAGYVIERSVLMATTFALAMQIAWLRGLLTGQVRWLALAVFLYFLAVFSKEHSVMMPAVLAAETILLSGRIQARRSALWVAAAGFAAVGTLVALIAKGVVGTPYEAMAAALFEQQGVAAAGDPGLLHVLSALTQAGLFFKYLLLWVLPNPAWMSVDMREPFASSLSQWQSWLGLGGFLGYGVLGLWLLLRRGLTGLAGLALLYPWLQFLLEFSSIRVQEPFVLYRSYLWMPGLMLFIPLLLTKWPDRKTMVAIALVVAALAPLAANRLWVFADNYRLWNDAALLLHDKHEAGADRIFFNRGQAEEGMGRIDDAIADFERSLAVSPQYAPVHFELGWLYGRKGRYNDAMAQFDASIANDPTFANGYYGKAMLLKIRHENKRAAELMAKSCELKQPIACLISKGFVQNKSAN